jgi:hypothetical protein
VVVFAVSRLGREHELLALALSTERKHGRDGPRVIAEKIGEFAQAGEFEAVQLWVEVARRYESSIAQHRGKKGSSAS